MSKTKTCKWCGDVDPRHFPFQCFENPKVKNRKPIKIGKVQTTTNGVVAKWKISVKPDHQGYYTCYICGRLTGYLIAEHPYSKVRHPELRTTQKLEPVCDICNELKGSLDIDKFLIKYPQYQLTVKDEYKKLIDKR